jgi:hypothetical protein
MKINKIVSGVILLLILVFVGCKKAETPALILKEIGPSKTKEGVGFNPQAHGESAIWANAQNTTDTTVIIWGKTKLQTFSHNKDVLTAPVPKELYDKTGRYDIYLLDTKTGAKSNTLIFTVQ